MNKKILIFCILSVFMLISISLVSANSSNNVKTVLKKNESPLFRIRTEQAIGEKIQELKTKFLGERLFFLPIQWIFNGRSISEDELNHRDTEAKVYCTRHTCNLEQLLGGKTGLYYTSCPSLNCYCLDE